MSQLAQKAKDKIAHLSSIQKPKVLFYLLLFLLPTQLGRHFWPTWSMQSGIRIDYLSPTIYLTDIIIFALILFAACSSERKKYFIISKAFLTISASTFLLWSLSIYMSFNPFFGWYELLKLAEFLMLFIIGRNLFKENAVNTMGALCFSAGLMLQSLLAILQVFFQHSLGGLWWLIGERTFSVSTPGIAVLKINDTFLLRGYGTLPHPNVLAAFLLVGIIWITHLAYSSNEMRSSAIKFLDSSRVARTIKALVLVIMSLGLLATMSRLPIVLGILYLVFKITHISQFRHPELDSGSQTNKTTFIKIPDPNFAIGYDWARQVRNDDRIIEVRNLLIIKKVLPFFVLFLAICILYLILYNHLAQRIFADPSLQDRLYLLTVAWSQIQKHLLFGLGFVKFITGSRAVSLNSSGIPQPVHNIFLLLLMSVGIVGSIPVVWVVWRLIQRALKNRLSLWLLLLVIILGSFDHYFLTLQQGQLLLVLVCILITRDNVVS